MHSVTLISGLLLAASSALAAPACSPSSGTNASTSPSGDCLPADLPGSPRAGDQSLIQALLLAPTAKQRIQLLNQPGDFKYDFNKPPQAAVVSGPGGRTVVADAEMFPALIGNGASMTLGFIGPCGFNTPHTHPRGTELNVVVQGRLVAEMTLENQTPAVQNLLNKFQMTVFPQGAMHTEFNPDCEDAVFVAGFSNVDPGVQQTAQTFFGLRDDIVRPALGVEAINGADIESFRGQIPKNVALGVDSCLAKCGIKKNPKRDLLA